MLQKHIAVEIVKLFQTLPHSVLTLSDVRVLVEPEEACVKRVGLYSFWKYSDKSVGIFFSPIFKTIVE